MNVVPGNDLGLWKMVFFPFIKFLESIYGILFMDIQVVDNYMSYVPQL